MPANRMRTQQIAAGQRGKGIALPFKQVMTSTGSHTKMQTQRPLLVRRDHIKYKVRRY